MTDRNAARNGVTDDVTNAVSNAAPRHATPLHSDKSTSSRSDAQRGGERFDIDEATALARVIASLRPDWRYADIRRAIAADDRPWSVVALASIRGAVDDTMRHPNGLRYANAAGETSDAARHPSARTLAEVRATTWCEGCGQPYSRCMCEVSA